MLEVNVAIFVDSWVVSVTYDPGGMNSIVP